MKPKYNVGDKVWVPTVRWGCHYVPCPVCRGRGAVVVHPLGMPEESQEVECGSCHNRDGALVQQDWNFRLSVDHVAIDGVRAPATNPTEYTYGTNGCSCFVTREDRVFDTREQAEAQGAILLKEAIRQHELEQVSRDAHSRKCEGSSAAFAVGYHRDAIARARKDVEYHLKQLRLPPDEFDAWAEQAKAAVKQQRIRIDQQMED